MSADNKCMFSVKAKSNEFVCSLVKNAKCDGALRGKMRCPFWNIAHQLCRMGVGKV